MDPSVIVAALVILILSGFVQGLVGFGSALVAVPLLMLFLEPRVVVPITLVHGLLMNMYLAVRNRRHMQRKRVLPLFLSACLGIPAGVLVLVVLPAGALKLLVGLLIVLFSLSLLSGRSRTLERESRALLPIGAASGFLNGSVSMSGPPVILFLSNQNVCKNIFRANLVTYFFLINIITFAAFYITGVLDGELLIIALVLSPPLPIGIFSGEYLSTKVNENNFRRIALLLVAAAGAAAALTGLFSLL